MNRRSCLQTDPSRRPSMYSSHLCFQRGNIMLCLASIATPSSTRSPDALGRSGCLRPRMTPQEEYVMKKNICNLAVLTVFAMALAGLSLAQDETYRVRVNIPFDFYAGDQQLPAGSYVFNVDYENHLVS